MTPRDRADGDPMIRLIKPRSSKNYKGSAKYITPTVLFLSDSPDREDAAHGVCFANAAGRHMDTLLEGMLPDEVCVFDNCVPEYLGGRKPLKKDFDQYAEYREKAVKWFKPKAIVALGANAIKALGIKASPSKHCGNIFQSAWGIPVIVSIHPTFILSDPTKIYLWQRVFAGIRSVISQRQSTFVDLRQIESPSVLYDWLYANVKTLCAVDIETTGFDPTKAELLTVAICNGKETIWFKAPVGHYANTLINWWSKGPRIVHNCKFELKWMNALGAKEPPVIYDTMLQAWLLNENEPKGLDHLVTTQLGHAPYWLNIDLKNTANVPIEKLGHYNALDAKYTYELHVKQRKQLGKVRCNLLDGIVSPLAALLVRMEERGVHVDRERLKAITTQMKGVATRKLKELAKQYPGVNFNSPNQMRELVFRKLGLKSSKKTKKGLKSVDGDVLDSMSEQAPALAKLAEAKKIKSLVARVLQPWADALDENDLIHTTFGIGQVVTGRLSSSNPNLQNLDRKSKKFAWKGIQKTVLVSRHKGGKIVQLDLKQGELRVAAAQTGDEAFLHGWATNPQYDPHQDTSDAIQKLGVECDRDKAKNVNFSIIYTITPHGLYEKYKIPKAHGSQIIPAWYKVHPRFTHFHNQCWKSVEKHGYVESIFGWRRHFDGFDWNDHHMKAMIVNFPIQNACVVICYLGMLAIENWLRNARMKSQVILQVHDSIVMDCPAKEAKQVAMKAQQLVEGLDLKPWVGNRLRHRIPIGCDVKIGDHL